MHGTGDTIEAFDQTRPALSILECLARLKLPECLPQHVMHKLAAKAKDDGLRCGKRLPKPYREGEAWPDIILGHMNAMPAMFRDVVDDLLICGV